MSFLPPRGMCGHCDLWRTSRLCRGGTPRRLALIGLLRAVVCARPPNPFRRTTHTFRAPGLLLSFLPSFLPSFLLSSFPHPPSTHRLHVFIIIVIITTDVNITIIAIITTSSSPISAHPHAFCRGPIGHRELHATHVGTLLTRPMAPELHRRPLPVATAPRHPCWGLPATGGSGTLRGPRRAIARNNEKGENGGGVG